MKKLYELKSWFSLADAAKRLSVGFGEPVTVNDIIQLVIEGRLPLSWYARGEDARAVAPYTTLAGKGYRPELNNLIFGENNEDSETQLLYGSGWAPIKTTYQITSLDGQFRLELDYCPPLVEWLHSQLTSTGGKLGSREGFFVSDSNGTIWQIMDFIFDSENPIVSGENDHRFQPTRKFPDRSELIITRQDMESFEREAGIILAEDQRQIISSNRKQPSSDDEYQFLRIGATWTITYQYTTRAVNDSKGMKYLHYLISHPHESIHVSTLKWEPNPIENSDEDEKEFSNMNKDQLASQGMSTGDLGDAGYMIDQKAVTSVKNEIRRLTNEIEDADKLGEVERSEHLKEERDKHLKYITAGTSLDGKPRRVGSVVEKQRTAVTNAVNRAFKAIEKAQHPRCASHLRHFIHTGTECKYTPDEEINWKL